VHFKLGARDLQEVAGEHWSRTHALGHLLEVGSLCHPAPNLKCTRLIASVDTAVKIIYDLNE
jgi:hypothetical protein